MDLKEIIRELNVLHSPEVLVGPETLDDAGVYKLTEELALLHTVDFITPISDDPYLFGKVAAANSLSDIYAMGGRPLTALNLCCFPEKSIENQILTEILRGGLEVIQDAGAYLLGGHTVKDEELKYGLSVMGVLHPKDIKTINGACPDEYLVLTKPIGTGVIITGAKMGLIEEELLSQALSNMARLNREAAEEMVALGASAATDITGYGLAGHGWGMALGSKLSLRFFASEIPYYPKSLELIRLGVDTKLTISNRESVGENIHFSEDLDDAMKMLFLDPQTSGGLLISITKSKGEELVSRLHERGVTEAIIVGETYAASRPSIEVTTKRYSNR